MTKKEILIVEDESDIRSLLKKFLEGKGYSITLAGDGRSAAEILKANSFDLLIIDALLPGEHGMDLINMKGNNFITPIILVSGIYDENEIVEMMKDPNVKYFAKKPFDLTDLHEKIEAAINEAQV